MRNRSIEYLIIKVAYEHSIVFGRERLPSEFGIDDEPHHIDWVDGIFPCATKL